VDFAISTIACEGDSRSNALCGRQHRARPLTFSYLAQVRGNDAAAAPLCRRGLGIDSSATSPRGTPPVHVAGGIPAPISVTVAPLSLIAATAPSFAGGQPAAPPPTEYHVRIRLYDVRRLSLRVCVGWARCVEVGGVWAL